MACRRRATQRELLRFMRSEENELALDSRRRLGGRGAWLCKSTQCFSKALKNKAFNRAFRGRVITPDLEMLVAEVSTEAASVMDG